MNRILLVMVLLVGRSIMCKGQENCIQKHRNRWVNFETADSIRFLGKVELEIGKDLLPVSLNPLPRGFEHALILEISNPEDYDLWIISVGSGDGPIITDCGDEGCMGWLLPSRACVEIMLRFDSKATEGPFDKRVSVVSFRDSELDLGNFQRSSIEIEGYFENAHKD
jgi:hypothetical protein